MRSNDAHARDDDEKFCAAYSTRRCKSFDKTTTFGCSVTMRAHAGAQGQANTRQDFFTPRATEDGCSQGKKFFHETCVRAVVETGIDQKRANRCRVIRAPAAHAKRKFPSR
jgi:hypothetical protein